MLPRRPRHTEGAARPAASASTSNMTTASSISVNPRATGAHFRFPGCDVGVFAFAAGLAVQAVAPEVVFAVVPRTALD